jgi:5-formyltetrahydrofolate cyclo-ligase
MASVSDDKSLLRAEMKARRAALARDWPYAGDALAQMATGWFAQHGWPQGVVAGYWPVQSEINPLPLLLLMAEHGASLALPVLEGEGELHMTFRTFVPGDALVSGPFGLNQPAPEKTEVRPDTILLPLLAFDDKGIRLGYGGGWYDRTVSGLRAVRPVTCFGVGFAAQQRDDIPAEVHDQRLDAILTEQSVVISNS